MGQEAEETLDTNSGISIPIGNNTSVDPTSPPIAVSSQPSQQTNLSITTESPQATESSDQTTSIPTENYDTSTTSSPSTSASSVAPAVSTTNATSPPSQTTSQRTSTTIRPTSTKPAGPNQSAGSGANTSDPKARVKQPNVTKFNILLGLAGLTVVVGLAGSIASCYCMILNKKAKKRYAKIQGKKKGKKHREYPSNINEDSVHPTAKSVESKSNVD